MITFDESERVLVARGRYDQPIRVESIYQNACTDDIDNQSLLEYIFGVHIRYLYCGFKCALSYASNLLCQTEKFQRLGPEV